MSILLLAVLAIVLAGPAPVLLGRARWVRRAPGTAMVLWQAVAWAGGLALIGTPLAWGLAPFGDGLIDALPAVAETVRDGTVLEVLADDLHGPARIAAVTVAVLVAVHLLLTLVMTAWRTARQRRRHRRMVELLAAPGGSPSAASAAGSVDAPGPAETTRPPVAAGASGTRVLPHDVPLAYCLPGLTGSLMVLSRGLLDQLSAAEVAAVVTHERAHLRQRHELLRLAFEAWHRAFAWLPTTATAQAAVAALTEMLADDAALRSHRRDDLVRALVRSGDVTDALRLEHLDAVNGRANAAGQPNGSDGEPDDTGPDAAVPLTLRLYRLLDPVPALTVPARVGTLTLALVVALLPVALLVFP